MSTAARQPRTAAERQARGERLRARVPRDSHAEWEPHADRDPVGILEVQAQSRVPSLVPIRYGRMLSSPFAFYRGAAAVMAADLARTPVSGIQAQLCGDAHLANFGAFASTERALVFDINDFDETHRGPWEWDLKRLAASFTVAARQRGYDEAEQRAIVGDVGCEYRDAMRSFARMNSMEVWYSRIDASEFQARWHDEARKAERKKLKRLSEKAHAKDRMRAFDRLTHVVDGVPRIISDPPLIVPAEELLSPADLAELQQEMREILDRYSRTLLSDRQYLLRQYRLVHVAHKVVGVGSVGTRTWIALLLGNDENDPLFLQFKEAQESVLAPFVAAKQYANEGERVIRGQRIIQATGDIMLGWTHTDTGFDGGARDFYVRQLWDWKGSADDTSTPARHPHLRQGLWPGTRAGARTFGRPDRDRRLPRQGQRVRRCAHGLRSRVRGPERPRLRVAASGRGFRPHHGSGGDLRVRQWGRWVRGVSWLSDRKAEELTMLVVHWRRRQRRESMTRARRSPARPH